MNTMPVLTPKPTEMTQTSAQSGARAGNPWISDHVLLNLSVWWVRHTQPGSPSFSDDVAETFTSLRLQLQ